MKDYDKEQGLQSKKVGMLLGRQSVIKKGS